jgi:xylulokinase
VTAGAAAATGLPAGCAVGVGAHDHACGLLALGADEPGVLLDSLGTAEALMLVTPAPSGSPALLAAGVNQGRVEAGGRTLFYLFGGLPTCSAAVEWFRSLWPGGVEHAALIAEAEAAPGAGGTLFLPQLRLGSPPFPDPVARGAFLGLSDLTDRGAMFRAVLEGLALDTANQLDLMRGHGAAAVPARVVATGGGSRNGLLMRLKAAATGLPVEVAEMPETTCLGAALLGGLAAGLYPDLATARRGLAVARRAVEPEPGWAEPERGRRVAAYAAAYARLREVQALLRPPSSP